MFYINDHQYAFRYISLVLSYYIGLVLGLWCFNANFNNISVISWQSVLLVEETGVHGENHRPVSNHSQSLSHNVVSSTPRHERDSKSQR